MTAFLAAAALALSGCAGAKPASKLVDLAAAEPSIVLDIRYATTDNFTKTAVYPAAVCKLRSPAAFGLRRAQAQLKARGLGLKVYDCYRPLSVQRKFWDLVPDERYVADPKKGSRHNRGMAVDATLVDAKGAELEMPTAYDDFSERAHRNAPASEAAVKNRRLLEEVLEREGFKGLPTEWWHFDFRGWEKAPVLDVPLVLAPREDNARLAL